jgi:hypothetical protein
MGYVWANLRSALVSRLGLQIRLTTSEFNGGRGVKLRDVDNIIQQQGKLSGTYRSLVHLIGIIYRYRMGVYKSDFENRCCTTKIRRNFEASSVILQLEHQV